MLSVSWARRSRCGWNRVGSCGLGGPDAHDPLPSAGSHARTPRQAGSLPASRVWRLRSCGSRARARCGQVKDAIQDPMTVKLVEDPTVCDGIQILVGEG